jgi:hypothetical protein
VVEFHVGAAAASVVELAGVRGDPLFEFRLLKV